MYVDVVELCLATLGVELHVLVGGNGEYEVGHGDAAAVNEELDG